MDYKVRDNVFATSNTGNEMLSCTVVSKKRTFSFTKGFYHTLYVVKFVRDDSKVFYGVRTESELFPNQS